jgi:ATP-dependent DNA helicase DinG
MENESIHKYFPFEEYRENQFETINTIVDSLKDKDINYFVLESPTGVGKSVVGYTASKILKDLLYINKPNNLNEGKDESGPEILIITSTRQLQKQYIDSFKNINDVEFIWSSKNYPCINYSGAEQKIEKVYYGHFLCPGKKDCPNSHKCAYLIQKNKFMRSKVGVTNYQYFFYGNFLKPKILICDEAHNIQQTLCDQATISISEYGLKYIANNINRNSNIKVSVKRLYTIIKKINEEQGIDINKHIKPYIKEFLNHFSDVVIKLEIEIDRTKNKDQLIQLNKIYEIITNLLDKYKKFIKSEMTWVISERNKEQSKIVIKPLDIYEYFNDLIAYRIKKCLFMSATICGIKQFIKELGIDEENYDYTITNSIIPVENRVVYYVNNLGSINYNNKYSMLPTFVSIIDRIIVSQLKKDPLVNGVIHTVSYENAELIKQYSTFSKNMIIPKKEDLLDISKLINKVNKNKSGKIIVSPSILEGVDLIDELSRYQIFIKVPYGFLGDNWVKTKANRDQKWYSRLAIIKMVQGSGRSIRSETDWANTYILDNNFSKLLSQHGDLIPEWYKESIKTISI